MTFKSIILGAKLAVVNIILTFDNYQKFDNATQLPFSQTVQIFFCVLNMHRITWKRR